MEIINDVPYRYGVIFEVNDGDSELSFKKGYRTVRVPVILGIKDQVLSEHIHRYIVYKAVSNRKDLKPYSKAFLSWCRFLCEHDIKPFTNAFSRIVHPTYGYRNYLIELVISNKLASSTASSYINTIKSFYEMLGKENYLSVDDYFQYETTHLNNYRKVQSTDLSIRVVNQKNKSLKPLNEQAQAAFNEHLKTCEMSFQLMLRFLIQSGLRLQEMLTLPASLFMENSLSSSKSNLIRHQKIGPFNGVKTKFGKERELFITRGFYEDVIDYLISEKYESLIWKWRTNHGDNCDHEPLFITAQGNCYNSNAFYQKWYKLKVKLGISFQKFKFNYKPHDLRATFATNFLMTALKNTPNNPSVAIGSLKYWLGHNSEETSMKYVEFLNNNEVSNAVASVMDEFINDAVYDESCHEK
jgi:integrase